VSAGSAPATLVPRKRRGAELALLLLALAIGISAYAMVGLGTSGKLPADLRTYAAELAALGLAAHLVVRLRAPYADPVLLPAVMLLNGLGLAMIHRIDLAQIQDSGKGAPQYAGLQLVWSIIGVALFILILFVLRDHRRLQAFTFTAGLLGLGLLLLPLVPGLGVNINGARIWIRFLGLSFQPGEVAKICLAVFFSGYLVVKRDALALAGRRFLGIDLPRGRDLGPIMLAWLASLGILVFETDLGSSLLFFGIFVVLLYVATERPGWLVVGILLFTGGAYAGYLAFSHVQERVQAWLNPFGNFDQNYQIIQSMFGLAWGGILGRGLGQGRPDLIPYSWSDFIAASLGEELGLAGLMAILCVYALIVERGLRTALICRDSFGKLLGVGLAVSLALQVFVVVGGVTRLIPLTGLTTPFLSYGGSSLVANWVIIALLLRISDQSRRPAPQLPATVAADDPTQVVVLR
jgi:cell division protein FtsW (lipid II flippase)